MGYMWNLGIYIQNCCPEHALLGCCLPPIQSFFNIKDPVIPVTLLLFMYTVLLKIRKSKPCSHLKLIMTQNLNILLPLQTRSATHKIHVFSMSAASG